jgi:lipooligosaccharide transport system ATP-binding protein
MTLVLTTHYMEEAERLCDQVTVMDQGRLLDSDSPRALIQRTIEPQVVEVHGPGLDSWRDTAQALSERCEGVGETLFCYCHHEQALLASVQGREDLVYLHRPANLEDVFVKLTGRELRDEQ